MIAATPTRSTPPHPPAGTSLGQRLRDLRLAAGLTQTELAGERFSKEYVSQIERGKTRPTRETIEWIAARLGVDPGFLANGVSTDERGRLDAGLSRAEALLEAERDEEARAAFEELLGPARATAVPEFELRALLGVARTRLRLGSVRAALDVLALARDLVESRGFSDVDRANVLQVCGVARYHVGSTQTALGLFNEALGLAERSGLPCDSLRSNVLSWRARCWRRLRDFEAAREDVERALELAQGVDDPKTLGAAYFQASLIADREGHWVLARTYAERAKAIFEQLSDRVSVGRLTNNLGGLNFLLGRPEEAVGLLKEAFSIALDTGEEADAAQAVNSLARVHLDSGDVALAEEHSRHAAALLEGREDFLDELGSAQVVLGRSLLQQERFDEAEAALRAADATFEQLGSASHRATAWIARGDLATRIGDDRTAARLYRIAAEALQDVRF
jgi:transcriptional regulator with XRE-family HTH domain